MKRILIPVLSVLLITVLSACGGAEAATPEISAEDLASTAVAEAWLVLTQTAAAVPTATAVPPTFTPQPSNTPAPLVLLPTLPPSTISVAVTSTPECNQIPGPEPKGDLVSVEFRNDSQGSTNLSFGMSYPNDKGECYTYSYTIGKDDVVSTKVLAGCYWGWAWITGATSAENSVAKSGDATICITDTAVIHKIRITQERVDFR